GGGRGAGRVPAPRRGGRWPLGSRRGARAVGACRTRPHRGRAGDARPWDPHPRHGRAPDPVGQHVRVRHGDHLRRGAGVPRPRHRYRAYSVGLFVMAPVVLGLGLCATVLYTAAGPLIPALHSYWIAIHVTAAILARGSFVVAAVMPVISLPADRSSRRGAERGAQDRGTGFGAVLRRLPAAGALDRLSYRTVVFAFPIWTFAIIAGAIWADQAWGRYWGWDPKETWAFITWVVYAGYLHARATAGWRGRKAAYI